MDARLARLARLTELRFPTAVALHLEPIREQHVGYMLNDVELPDGLLLTDADRDAFAAFFDEIYNITSTIPEIVDSMIGVHVSGFGAVTIDIATKVAE
jgi:hypothetical protein